jgi:Ricin-type beta-trefoil lectin domain
MIKFRAKTSAVIVAAILTMGSAIGLTIGTAPPAHAFVCQWYFWIYNGQAKSHFLDDYGGGSGTYVHTYPFTQSGNQTWCLEAASQGGYYFHPVSNEGLCLDTHTYNPGQRVWVYTCNGTLPQRWCWNGNGYIVTEANAHLALHDWGQYRTVTIENGGNNTWVGQNGIVDNC